MISVQITGPQSVGSLTKIFTSSIKIQINNNDYTSINEERLKQHGIAAPNNRTVFLLTASYVTGNSINAEHNRQYNRVEQSPNDLDFLP